MKISIKRPGLILILSGLITCLPGFSLLAEESEWTVAIGAKYHQAKVKLMDEKLKDEISDINREYFGTDDEDLHRCSSRIDEFNNGGPFCLTIFSETEFRDEVISPSVSLYLPDRFLGSSNFGYRSILVYGSFQTNEQYIPIYKSSKDEGRSFEARDIGTSLEANYLLFTPTVFYSFFGHSPPYIRLGLGVGAGLIRIKGSFTNSYLTLFDNANNETFQRGETINFSNDTTLMTAGAFLEFKVSIFSLNLEMQVVSKQIGDTEFSYEFLSSSATFMVDIF